MFNIPALNTTDAYKCGHIFQYPDFTEEVYSNFTPRSDRLAAIKLPPLDGFTPFDGKLVWFGLQAFIRAYLIEHWNRTFFHVIEYRAVGSYQRRMNTFFGPGAIPVDHIRALHQLGYLPIEIRALSEGSRVPMRVPAMTIVNTKPEFYWVTNYLETALSSELWKASTVATIAYEYRRLLDHYADLTGAPKEFVQWQGHDFSMRGVDGVERAALAGVGHLLSFTGTDTVAAVDLAEMYYQADAEMELIGASVPATEHSVMCMGGEDGEEETFRRLITDVYPSGIVSIVSDTWDFWHVIGNTARKLKQEILDRKPNALGNAKVVFRPDSGDPVKILTGYTPEEAAGLDLRPEEAAGAVETLWNVFGGRVNDKGFRELDPHVGLIYGDSITLERAQQILHRLKEKGFASSCVVFGIGSYTYQYLTRDTFGFAVKATAGTVKGEHRELFKDPVTDSGTKRSAKGYVRVEWDGEKYILLDQQTRQEAECGALRRVFKDGELEIEQSLAEIRQRLGAITI